MMLDTPSVLLLNCLGSYFYSIVQSVAPPGREDVLLYYLSSGRLSYRKLSLEVVREKYADNPWGYQPVEITDSQSLPLAIDSAFFRYLSRTHNIAVDTVDMNRDRDLAHRLTRHTGPGQFHICNVDEYYVSASHKFCGKRHNKHFLLVKSVAPKDHMLEIIDSEKDRPYFMTIDEMERAVYQSKYQRKLVYRIDCRAYADNTFDSERLLSGLRERSVCEYLPSLQCDMQRRLSQGGGTEPYFYRGYYYTVLSKILPYSQMLSLLLKDAGTDARGRSESLSRQWRDLCHFMLYKMGRGRLGYEPVAKKLDHIHDESRYLDECIRGRNPGG